MIPHPYPHNGRKVVLVDAETCRFAREGEIPYGEIREPFWSLFDDEALKLWAHPANVAVLPWATLDTGSRHLFRLAPDTSEHDPGDEDPCR